MMSDGREKSEWNRASCLLAMIYNVNCQRRGDRKRPTDFNPTLPRRSSDIYLTIEEFGRMTGAIK